MPKGVATTGNGFGCKGGRGGAFPKAEFTRRGVKNARAWEGGHRRNGETQKPEVAIKAWV